MCVCGVMFCLAGRKKRSCLFTINGCAMSSWGSCIKENGIFISKFHYQGVVKLETIILINSIGEIRLLPELRK